MYIQRETTNPGNFSKVSLELPTDKKFILEQKARSLALGRVDAQGLLLPSWSLLERATWIYVSLG